MQHEMEGRSTELPDECWAMIFNWINQGSDWESVSLVCKRFLSITNLHRVSLKIFCPSIQVLSRQLQTYPHLRKIELMHFLGDLNQAILAVAQSGLKLEELDLSCNEILPTVCLEELGATMKNLKVLDCSRSSLTDAVLVRIANSFPQLEELHIGHSAVTDDGIEFLSSKLKRLRKIDLSLNQCISDRALISLSSNCAFLEQITVWYCRCVTENGISFLIHNSYQLNDLRLAGHFKLGSFGAEFSANVPKNLQLLKFIQIGISDEFLQSLTEARIPLREFSLSFCKGYTFAGIKSVIHSFQSLRSLCLLGAKFLTNEHIEQLSPFLHYLTDIWLYTSPMLSGSTFAMLVERCPFLNDLIMGETSLGREEYNYDSAVKNFAVRSLMLRSNRYLSSCHLRKLLNLCPNVEKLDLRNCFQRDEELDVADILQCGSGIISLKLSGCSRLKFSAKDVEISKLERLAAQYSGFNDEMLAMIGRICPRLVHLDLEDCNNVTEEGIKEVVSSCKRLRYLSLSACSGVNSNIIGWIVSTRPSLRQLVSPSSSYPDDEQQKYFLQQGCRVNRDRVLFI